MTRGISLHIGLNRLNPASYDGWDGPLTSCENDMLAMRDLCRSRNFAHRTLPTAHATRQAVTDAIREAAQALETGDLFVLTYSGHGASIPNGGPEEPDRRDEAWCLYDGRLFDDTLYELWFSFGQGVRVLVVSDSCHSATMLYKANIKLGEYELADTGGQLAEADTGERLVARDMPARVRDRLAAQLAAEGNAARALRPMAELQSSILLLSACQDHELAWGDADYGIFTRALINAVNRPNPPASYPALITTITQSISGQQPSYLSLPRENPAFLNGPTFAV